MVLIHDTSEESGQHDEHRILFNNRTKDPGENSSTAVSHRACWSLAEAVHMLEEVS